MTHKLTRKLVVAALIFAAAFAFGIAPTHTAQAAGNCYFKCDCAGNPLYCCIVNGNESCKPDTSGLWQCPQVYNC